MHRFDNKDIKADIKKNIRFYRSRKTYDPCKTSYVPHPWAKHEPWFTMDERILLSLLFKGIRKILYKWEYVDGDMHARAYQRFDCRISLDTLVQLRVTTKHYVVDRCRDRSWMMFVQRFNQIQKFQLCLRWISAFLKLSLDQLNLSIKF